MTLADMALFVCRKVRATDADAIAQCRTFLRQRYEVVARDELWNDLLYSLAWTWVAVPAGFDPLLPVTWDDVGSGFNTTAIDAIPFGNFFSRQAGVWHLPPTVDRVLALRRSDQGMGVIDEFQLYQQSPDVFAQTGTPVGFHTLGQVVVAFEGQLDLMVGPPTVMPWDGSYAVGGFLIGAADPSDYGVTVRVSYTDMDGEVVEVEQQLVDPESVDYLGDLLIGQNILSVTKPATGGAVTVAFCVAYSLSAAGSGAVVTIPAGNTTARRCPRIRVYPIPTADTAFRALVKLKPRVLTNDNDEPEIRGIDNCLLALAQGDMLERGRQYGKAQGKHAEGLALLEQAKKAHTWQEARSMQILPEVYEQSGSVAAEWNPWAG